MQRPVLLTLGGLISAIVALAASGAPPPAPFGPLPTERQLAWQQLEFFKGTSIGNRRLVRGERITTNKVRLRVTRAAACPALSEIGLIAEPIPAHPAEAASP